MTDILRLSVPLTIWLAAFSAIYGLEGLVCSDRWAQANLSLAEGRTVMVIAWLVAIAIQVSFLLALRSPRFVSRSIFVRGISVSLAAVALVATLWTLAPVVATTACL